MPQYGRYIEMYHFMILIVNHIHKVYLYTQPHCVTMQVPTTFQIWQRSTTISNN